MSHLKMGIKLARRGCANRPFYLIVVAPLTRRYLKYHEQIGTYDPLPNERNEKLVALNLERFQYWIGHGAPISPPVSELLGLAGYLPINPKTYITAWTNRRKSLEANEPEIKSDSQSS